MIWPDSDAVVVVGDLTQRNFRGQLRAARQWLDIARSHTKVLTVPGNHDVAWWWKPAGVGPSWPMYRGYRKWISRELEPQLRLPGVTIVGLNSCHGVRPYTLTRRLKDISIVGAILPDLAVDERACLAQEPGAAAQDQRLGAFDIDLDQRGGAAEGEQVVEGDGGHEARGARPGGDTVPAHFGEGVGGAAATGDVEGGHAVMLGDGGAEDLDARRGGCLGGRGAQE